MDEYFTMVMIEIESIPEEELALIGSEITDEEFLSASVELAFADPHEDTERHFHASNRTVTCS